MDDRELESSCEADDGVVELERVLAACAGLRVHGLAPGPRRWALADVGVDVDAETVAVVRLTFRTRDGRAVVVGSRRPETDRDAVAERLATPLAYAALREQFPLEHAAAVIAAVDGRPRWGPPAAGWQYGQAGAGTRPVRLAAPARAGEPLLLASLGVAAEELAALALNAEVIVPGGAFARDLGVAHRRYLAQRWWDAPRQPWRPERATASPR